MDVHHLRCFLAVVQEGHFGRAAERLHLTTSPVSRAVRELEREIGAQLLVRGSREVTPTPAGVRLAERGAVVLEAFDALLPDVRATVDLQRRVVRVGSTHLTEPEVVDAVVEVVRKAVPDREVVVELCAPVELQGMLELGVLDLAVAYLPLGRPALRSRTVVTYRMGIAMRAGDPLAERSRLSMADVADRTIQLPSATPAPASVGHLRHQLEERGARDVRLFPASDVVALAEHIRRTGDLALSFVNVRTGATRVFYEPAFCVLPVADGPEMIVGVGWRGDRQADEPLATVLAAVSAHWPGGGQPD
ncbi:LysR family transcriptional regulator [Cryptosporangium aurantiacum]|uniref:DNA-binding transcriptional regulator, LysR family n=1 Tax=Cryptosporangium aurantiacum TaxID=134849 RepID=A0A1M7R4F9_9ACTN|nr:LysR family transcriptional regulator [Cryptosporangium aurantiacum]SHN39961.1 DNA-binding transcriptional regulator, LysR family [Cryptosporangium aurantiacum]